MCSTASAASRSRTSSARSRSCTRCAAAGATSRCRARGARSPSSGNPRREARRAPQGGRRGARRNAPAPRRLAPGDARHARVVRAPSRRRHRRRRIVRGPHDIAAAGRAAAAPRVRVRRHRVADARRAVPAIAVGDAPRRIGPTQRSRGADAVTPNDPAAQTHPAAVRPSAPVIVPPAPVEPDVVEPLLEEAVAAPRLRNRLQIAIVVILLLYTCAIAEAVVVPVLIAMLFGLMLAPPVRLLERSRVPRALSSLLLVLLAIAIIGGAITALASPARAWIGRMPTALVHIQSVMKDIRRPFQM